MKKLLPILLFSSLFLISACSRLAFAQFRLPKDVLQSTVSASVGDFYLNISGYIAPFASILLTTDGIYLRATTADQFGYFTISQVLIKKGFSHFCFDAVDFKRLGESYTCLTIPPAQGAIALKNIFLPPTLGLSRSQIAAGSSTTAYGYSMPGAIVTLHFGGKTYTTHADSTGYYQFLLKNVKAGIYQLYPTAVYKDKPSLEPTKKLTLKALSPFDQFLQWLRDLWKRITQFFTSLSFGPLWLAIPILILIIILILKLWPDRFTFIYRNRLTVFLSKPFKNRKHPLHHSWWMGY